MGRSVDDTVAAMNEVGKAVYVNTSELYAYLSEEEIAHLWDTKLPRDMRGFYIRAAMDVIMAYRGDPARYIDWGSSTEAEELALFGPMRDTGTSDSAPPTG